MRSGQHRWAALAIGGVIASFIIFTLASVGAASPVLFDFTPTAHAYVPLALAQPTSTPSPTPSPIPSPTAYACPSTSSRTYSAGIAYQFDTDNPVRPAYAHADKNIALRSYTLNISTWLKRELVNYGSDDPKQPPQLATLFEPYRVPTLRNFYQVYQWLWAPSPDPGTRGEPITDYPVTALGLATTPGELLRVPISGYDIGGGMEVIVLFADADTVALRYTREDSSGSSGYTLHVSGICTDPALLALYNALDAPSGPRYI
ncbi:MAG: hypothetical protein GX601_05565 [Anaerolineales bacterium]|nr:hypothetical protein [Anaerolineales bacterium]